MLKLLFVSTILIFSFTFVNGQIDAECQQDPCKTAVDALLTNQYCVGADIYTAEGSINKCKCDLTKMNAYQICLESGCSLYASTLQTIISSLDYSCTISDENQGGTCEYTMNNIQNNYSPTSSDSCNRMANTCCTYYYPFGTLNLYCNGVSVTEPCTTGMYELDGGNTNDDSTTGGDDFCLLNMPTWKREPFIYKRDLGFQWNPVENADGYEIVYRLGVSGEFKLLKKTRSTHYIIPRNALLKHRGKALFISVKAVDTSGACTDSAFASTSYDIP